MPDADVLLTIAEVAVAFAGFAGLVSILGRRSSRDPSVVQAARLRALIVSGLLVVAFAFVPFVPYRVGLSDLVVWRISSGLFALATAGVAWVAWDNARRVRAVGPSPRGFFSRGLVIASDLAVAGALLVANAFGAFPDHAAAVYIASLLLLLFLAGFMFANLLLSFLASPES